MSGPEVLTEIVGPIARLTFNRPQARNALTAGMLVTMREFLKTIENDDAIRCLMITGAGEHFMAGGDVAGFGTALQDTPDARRRDFEERARAAIPIFATLQRMGKPVVAKVRGAAAGASISWIAASDYVIASDTALLVFAHIHIGASPDGGLSWHLPRAIGLRKAKELLLLGERVTAAQALAYGLINRVVDDAALDEEADKIVQRFAAAPCYAIGRTKELLNAAANNSQAQQMELEAAYFGACAAKADFLEGIRSFGEKRRPVFTGN